MFADDVGLLPGHMFTRMLEQARRAPRRFTDLAATLFRGMAKGGLVGIESVDWFNGGLFDDEDVLPLERSDVDAVLAASKLDWSEIDPSAVAGAVKPARGGAGAGGAPAPRRGDGGVGFG